eukprot:m.116210 g.116210  ORF g.116210 m.116210 type:complete len:746 (+) comp14226_c0_seq4:155-2392(+)
MFRRGRTPSRFAIRRVRVAPLGIDKEPSKAQGDTTEEEDDEIRRQKCYNNTTLSLLSLPGDLRKKQYSNVSSSSSTYHSDTTNRKKSARREKSLPDYIRKLVGPGAASYVLSLLTNLDGKFLSEEQRTQALANGVTWIADEAIPQLRNPIMKKTLEKLLGLEVYTTNLTRTNLLRLKSSASKIRLQSWNRSKSVNTMESSSRIDEVLNNNLKTPEFLGVGPMQDIALPSLQWDDVEEVAVSHMLLVIAEALRDSFLEQVTTSLQLVFGTGYKGVSVDIKPFVSLQQSIYSREFYRREKRPRSLYNLDLLRSTVIVEHDSDICVSLDALSKQFNRFFDCTNHYGQHDRDLKRNSGDTRVKCVAVRLNVLDGHKRTYGEMNSDGALEEAFRKHRSKFSLGTQETAMRMAKEFLLRPQIQNSNVQLKCEVQVLTRENHSLESELEVLNKILGCRSAKGLFLEFGKPIQEQECPVNIMVAASLGNLDSVREHFHGKDLEQNEIPQAVCLAAQHGHLDVVLFLIQRNDLNLDACLNKYGSSPLWLAAREGHIDIIRCLLRHGSSINHPRPRDNTTPLFVAAERGHTDVVSLLLDLNAHPDELRSEDEISPLLMSAQNGYADIVELLLIHDASVEIKKPSTGSTAMHVAAQQGHDEIIRMLLGADADINVQRTDDHRTPLHCAALQGRVDTVRLLLANGADTKKTTSIGGNLTPLQIARKYGSKNRGEVVKLLSSKMPSVRGRSTSQVRHM